MHVSLDRHGNAVVSGEGMHRRPLGANQSDVMMNSAAQIAELTQERENAEILAQNRALDRQAQHEAWVEDQEAYEESLALDYENYQREELMDVYGGENPMAYIAALQTMAGAVSDCHMPLSGYAHSGDGRAQYDAHLAPHSPLRGAMGDWLSDLTAQLQDATQSAKAIYEDVSPLVESVQDLIGTDQPSGGAAPSTAAAPRVVRSVASTGKGLLSAKIGPVPVVALLALGAVGIGVVVLKKRR